MDIKKDNQMYMQVAMLASERSYAKRLKVGCVIVKNNSIEVQHAELNAIAKLAYNGYCSKDAAIFITHSPCIHCALLIQKCGISHVYYHEMYRDDTGIQFLRNAGIVVEQI